MLSTRRTHLFAIAVSLALHALVWGLVIEGVRGLSKSLAPPKPRQPTVLTVDLHKPPPPIPKVRPPIPSPKVATPKPSVRPLPVRAAVAPTDIKSPATQAAPPPPTAQEWAFAAQYTQKNSKGFRYHWGQQVRSMMGTATEGPDQGVVRFRVEIAANGTLVKLETLWTTSAKAEELARKAIRAMPPLPPTPTGQPLIFDRTISFSPFASDGPPSYKDDCLPDPPVFRNPFAWDGKSEPTRTVQPAPEKLDPQALADCLKQLPRDSMEAVIAEDQRAMDKWGWRK